MSDISDLTEKKAQWEKALDAVSKGQNYSIDGMSVSRVPAEEIRKTIGLINRQISNLSRGGKTSRAVFR